jgi:hypothetical protein
VLTLTQWWAGEGRSFVPDSAGRVRRIRDGTMSAQEVALQDHQDLGMVARRRLWHIARLEQMPIFSPRGKGVDPLRTCRRWQLRTRPDFLDHGQLKLPLTRAGSETDSFLLSTTATCGNWRHGR